MLIFGHQAIKCADFVRVKNIQEIASHDASKIVYFTESDDVDFGISKHCKTEKIPYAIMTNSPAKMLIYAQLQAGFILVDSPAKSTPVAELLQECKNQDLLQSSPLKKLQNIADHYLLDTKIILIIAHEQEIELAAFLGIDGVIFSDFLE